MKKLMCLYYILSIYRSNILVTIKDEYKIKNRNIKKIFLYRRMDTIKQVKHWHCLLTNYFKNKPYE